MNNQQTVINMIKAISGQANVLTIPRIFITLTGDIKAALFLSQCIYWSDKVKREDGYFYKDANEWEEETGLTRREQIGARKKLKTFIDVKLLRANGAPTLHYRVNFDALADSILTFCENHEMSKSDLYKMSKSDLDILSKSLTETTHRLQDNATQSHAPKGRADPRTGSPAIQLVRSITGRYPAKANYQRVINILGDKPDEERAVDCYEKWTFGGRNPNGLGWLDWYKNGIPEWVSNPQGGHKNGGKTQQKTEVTPAPVTVDGSGGFYA